MIYAFRKDGQTLTLVELQNKKHLGDMTMVTSKDARKWVLSGGLHETGLWVDLIDDRQRKRRKPRYATSQEQRIRK